MSMPKKLVDDFVAQTTPDNIAKLDEIAPGLKDFFDEVQRASFLTGIKAMYNYERVLVAASKDAEEFRSRMAEFSNDLEALFSEYANKPT